MTRRHETETDTDDRLIDRLVDGELGEAERRALLARLEATPGGWRRCALAFLEAQAWRGSLARDRAAALAVAAPSALAGGTIGPRPRRPSGPRSGRPRVRALVAAGWVVAFAAGWLASASARGTRPHVTAAGPVASESAPRAGPRVTTPAVGRQPGSRDQGDDGPGEAVARPVAHQAEAGDDEDFPLADPVRRQLERRGYRVEPRQGLMSVRLEDGRSLSVPVDGVQLRFVGDRTY